MIPATEYMQAAKRFQSIFELNLNDYCDKFLTTDKEFALDLCKFSEHLEEKFPYMMNEDLSMQDVVRHEYGEEANMLLTRMII